MKPIYVKQWHGITLSSIRRFNINKIPEVGFYADFYEKFFKIHHSWEDLEPDWVDHKINSAKFIQTRLAGRKRSLSIGCGIGVIEKYLLESGVRGLEIHEISKEALRWIRPLFEKEAVHFGRLQESMGTSGEYDYIFLSVVDYCLDEQEWAGLLREVRGLLSSTGRCLVITPTIHLSQFEFSEMILWIKFKIKIFLSGLGIYDLGQLVGYRRNKSEFRDAMISAGFNIREEGFLGRDAMFSKTYWIEGTLV